MRIGRKRPRISAACRLEHANGTSVLWYGPWHHDCPTLQLPECATPLLQTSAALHPLLFPNTLLVETPEDTPEDDVCHLPSHMMNGVSYVVEYSLV